jgi:bis(5'-nucleosyl)-tetraphosphatase (symmetrical)
MATWAIGDVQGCMASLEQLLDRINFDPARDRLWMVGDLVNRGPRSLDVLRWAQRHGDAVVAVLGNHDLHLLQRVAGTAAPKKRDTLDDVLAAPDRDALIDWLRARPLVHVEHGWILVHGGLHPRWTARKARKVGAEIEEGLRGERWDDWLGQLVGKVPPAAWDDDLEDVTRIRSILGYLVRARCLDSSGAPDPEFADHPRRAPRGLTPWFEVRDPDWADHRVVFGHWAALGLSIGPRHAGIDSGCVWGGSLTAFKIEDQEVVQVRSVER